MSGKTSRTSIGMVSIKNEHVYFFLEELKKYMDAMCACKTQEELDDFLKPKSKGTENGKG